MGIALLVPGISFRDNNLGRVTLAGVVPVQRITIAVPDSIVDEAQAIASFSPSLTTQRDVTWTIESGAEYASISSTGAIFAKKGASNSPITIRATSTENPNVYAEATTHITASFEVDLYAWIQPKANSMFVVPGFTQYGGKAELVGSMGAATNGYLMSALDTSNNAHGTYLQKTSYKKALVIGPKYVPATSGAVDAEAIFRDEFFFSVNSATPGTAKSYLNDELYYTNSANIFALNSDIFFFSLVTSSAGPGSEWTRSGSTWSKGKLYSYKIWDSEGVLKLSIRAAKDMNEVPCLYDEVSKRFFYNTEGEGKVEVGNE